MAKVFIEMQGIKKISDEERGGAVEVLFIHESLHFTERCDLDFLENDSYIFAKITSSRVSIVVGAI